MARPSRAAIAAAQAVLYRPARVRAIDADVSSISVLLNIDNPNGGDEPAPFWIQATGEVDPRATEAIMRARRVAATMRTIAGELGRLQAVPAGDRQALKTAIGQHAAAWDARADAWAAPGRPDDVDALVATISGHVRAAATAQRKVKRYFREHAS